MKIITPDQWKPADGIQLEQAALESVRSSANDLVIAGPGAGKTELLAQKAGFLFSTGQCADPRKILAISFKKDAAENLKKRIAKRYGKEVSERFMSQTYDAFAKSILDRFRMALPEECIPHANYATNDFAIIEAAYDEAWGPLDMKKNAKQNFLDNMLASVALPVRGDSKGEKLWRMLLRGFQGNEGCLSFKMITMLVIYIIRNNPQIKKALQLTYSHVFLDEFQDTTDLQYELVKTCFRGSGCVITAVGDNKQRIMLWAGARKTIFDDFRNDFGAVTMHLVMNHRSAPRLVDLQKLMYNSLNDAGGIVQASKKWNEKDGDIVLLISKDLAEEETWLARNIRQRINEGISPNDICILCKQKPEEYTNGLINRLESNGIHARIENEYQDLLKEPLVILIMSSMKLVNSRRLPDEWDYVMDEMSSLNGVSRQECGKDDYYKMQDAFIGHLDEWKDQMKVVDSQEGLMQVIHSIVEFYGAERIKAKYIAYARGNYYSRIFERFVTLFWEELKKAKFDWELSMINFEGSNTIPIMTIHKSKGLEYSVVYFVGLEDSAFWNFKKQPEEDRCAFFVALSRAKQYVIFTFCKFRTGWKWPEQRHDSVNEFFELLRKPGMARVEHASTVFYG